MSDSGAADRERVDETFTAVRQAIRAERRRTATERRAFAAFADRISEIAPSITAAHSPETAAPGPSPGASGTTVASRSPAVVDDGADPTRSLERAYEETVMSVPFYEAEYGDDYREAIREELGPEIATAVTDADCFSPGAKRMLLAAVRRAAQARTRLVGMCTRERESVDAAANTLYPLASEVDTIAAEPVADAQFGTLEARWMRLSTLADRCEAAATTRQEDIDDLRTRYDLPVDAPDVCAYLYQGFDAAYPVLETCANLRGRLDDIRQRHERAMAAY